MRQLVAVAAGLVICSVGGKAAAQLAETGTVCSQAGLGCRYWTPPSYDPAKRYPVVLYLHSAGDAGSNNTSQVDGWGSFPHAFFDADRPAKYQFFFLAPQAPSDEGDSRWVNWDWSKGSYDINAVPESASMKVALSMLDTLASQFNIDPDRVYVVGESMGGFGAWDAMSRHPERFAGGIPTDGGGSPQAAPRLTNMAILSAHYGMDGSVPVSSDREMFAAIAAAGGRPLYVEIAQAAHGVAGAINGQESVFEWLFSQRRGVPPSKSPELLDFSPAGGVFPAATDVTLSSGLGTALRYTTDGSVPTPSSGLPYTSAVHLSSSTILEAALFLHDDDGDRSIYHAAPFQIGDTPLPPGVTITPPASSGGASLGGSAAAAGTAGMMAASTGGSAVISGGGNAIGGAASTPYPSGGTSIETGPLSGGPTSSSSGGMANDSGSPSSGCSVAPAPGAPGRALLLVAAALLGRALRRRQTLKKS